MKSFLSLAVVLFGAVSCDDPRATSSEVPRQENSTDVIKYLVSLPHGPDRTNERGRQLLAQLRAHPQDYVAAVREELELVDDLRAVARSAGPEKRSPGPALGLARALGKEHGGPLVRHFFDATQERIAKLRHDLEGDGSRTRDDRTAALRRLLGLRSSALRSLESFRDTYAVESVLRTIDQTAQTVVIDPGQVVMLEYLRTVVPRDPDVYRRLREMADDPRNPLHQDRAFQHVLRSLSPAENVDDDAANHHEAHDGRE